MSNIRRAALLLAFVLVSAGLIRFAPTATAQDLATVQVGIEESDLKLTPTPCGAGLFVVTMTNDGDEPIFGTADVDGDGLDVSAQDIVSYLPAGYTYRAPVQIVAPSEDQLGDHTITVDSGDSHAELPVTVDDSAIGDNLARSAVPTSSTSYPGRTPCGALDGNTDSDSWDSGVGWSDNTNNAFPDWWAMTFDEPQTINTVVLDTVDSAALPAETQGLRDWDIQVPKSEGADPADADAWKTVASVRDNVAAQVTSEFDAEKTTAVRVACIGANGHYSRILELSAYNR